MTFDLEYVKSRLAVASKHVGVGDLIVNEELGELIEQHQELYHALKHVLAGTLSLPRFAEEEGRSAIAKAEASGSTANGA